MKTIMTIIIASALLWVSLPLIQVSAGGPYTEKTPIDEVHTIEAGKLCPFDVTASIEGVMVMKTWFDKFGNPVRSLDNYRQRWTYSANGITLKANTGGPSHITFISPTEVELRYAGAYTLVTARGKGVVFGSAGQGYEIYKYQVVKVILDENENPVEIYGWVMVDSTFKSGINAFWDPTQFCAALTP